MKVILLFERVNFKSIMFIIEMELQLFNKKTIYIYLI